MENNWNLFRKQKLKQRITSGIKPQKQGHRQLNEAQHERSNNIVEPVCVILFYLGDFATMHKLEIAPIMSAVIH